MILNSNPFLSLIDNDLPLNIAIFEEVVVAESEAEEEYIHKFCSPSQGVKVKAKIETEQIHPNK